LFVCFKKCPFLVYKKGHRTNLLRPRTVQYCINFHDFELRAETQTLQTLNK